MRFEHQQLDPEGSLVRALGQAHASGEKWASSWSKNAVLTEGNSALVMRAMTHSNEEAGCLFLRPPGALWEITLVFVLPKFRGSGVIEGLVEAAKRKASESWLREARPTGGLGPTLEVLSLEVRADNLRALTAYRRIGFREVGVRKSYYRDQCDAILMETSLFEFG
jgi:ribosomal protein S18 acetylase RimI-like enzyme